MEQNQIQPVILVTGFGPFANFKINPSWQAVQLLPDELEGCKIVKTELPVCYEGAEERITKLWMLNQPKLVLHVGAAGQATKITLEKKAYRYGYNKLDCFGKCHPSGSVCSPELGDDCLSTDINVEEICDILNKNIEHIKFESSENAGRYLCEYTYYMSLRQDRSKCIFVHVPPLNEKFDADHCAVAILEIIKCALKQQFSSD